MQMDETFLRYNALDSACMVEIHNKVWPDLEDDFLDTYNMTLNIFPVLMFMQTKGVRVSHDLLDETKVDVLRTIKEKQAELDELVGHPLNVDSSKQCIAYFYGEKGITPYLNKNKKPTVDDKALQRLVRGTSTRPGLKEAKLIQDIRGLGKLYGTYLNMSFDSDSRMRGSYNPRGTKFGRLSSSKTIFDTGMNFQNLPSEFKKFLVPDPGYVFLELDKRQAEWVVVAFLTGDANMMAAFEQGIDVHTHTAHLMYNVPHEVIKLDNKLIGHSSDAQMIMELRLSDPILKDYAYSFPRTMSVRQAGKKSNHGLNYDEGYRGFAMTYEIDEKEAKRIYELYHKIYPGIKIWYEAIQRQLRAGRTLTNCFGRKVRFLGQWGDDLFKSAYSMLPQSTVVDSLNQGMERTYEDKWITKELNVDILAQVHDSILMQVPIDFVKDERTFNELHYRLTEYTSPDLTYNGRTFRIASDFKCGLNWGEFNKTTNNTGMVEIETHADLMKALEGWESISGTRASGLA